MISPLADPYRWVVEEGAVRHFAAAVGEHRPIGPGSVAGPTFLQTAMRWFESERDFVKRLDFDFGRVLHGGSTFEYGTEPIRVGEELFVTEGHSARRVVEGRSGQLRMADAHLLISDASGAIRARVVHRIVERPEG